MKIDPVVEMIHKNGNLVDQSNGLPLKQRKSAIKELILNNNSVIALNNNIVEEERHSVDSNDDNNNDHFIHNSFRQYKCPVCKSDQFTAGDLLDQHLRTHHPTYRPSCRDCGELFPTLKSLARHSIMHVTDNTAMRHNPLNSKILDFLENKKFLLQQLSDSIETSQSYRCNFCGEHFTGAHFMSHWKQCKQFPSEASINSKLMNEGEEVKSSFFAGLNLHSRHDSRNSSDTESYGSTKSEHNDDEPKVPSHLINAIQNAPPSYPVTQFESEEEKKLTKDESDFLNRVRDMKRRGEFPCRLCTKVFRNLRALKGHARVHIAGIRNSRPYQCNICLFSTTDKSVIIRHIRNHNGDHPYKCQLCLSTFTTKANCERHLRNAHRKTSREDIKRLLVDLNNKQQNNTSTSATTTPNPTNTINKLETLLTSGQVKDTKDRYRSITGSFSSSHHDSSENDERSRTSLQLCDRSEHQSDPEDSSNSNDSNNNTNSNLAGDKKLDSYHLIPMLNAKYSDFRIAGLLDRGASKAETDLYKNNLMMRTGLMLQDNGFIKVSPFAQFCDPEPVETEEPLDLSVDFHDSNEPQEDEDTEGMDTTDDAAVLTGETSDTEALVLDLRKKRDTDIEDLSVRNRNGDLSSPATPRDSLHQSPQLFLNTPYAFPTAPIMPNLSQFFVPSGGLGAAFPGVPKIDAVSSGVVDETHPSKLRPLIYEHLVANAGDRFDELRQSVPAFVDFTKAAAMGPASDRDDRITAVAKDVLAAKVRSNSKSSTVKMVMKDGVLVEKQKQRRYRTEKPFSCAYCPGRFTLRSNMDRHVKQQHPSHWRQRQRGGSSRAQRTKLKDDTSDSISIKSEPQTHQMEVNSMEGECDMSFEKRSLECSDVDADDDMDIEMKKDEPMDNCGIGEEDDEDGEDLVIDEEVKDAEVIEERSEVITPSAASIDKETTAKEENPDLASVRSLLDNVSTQTFSQYFGNEEDRNSKHDDGSEEDEEGLVAGSSSEGNGSGGEENR